LGRSDDADVGRCRSFEGVLGRDLFFKGELDPSHRQLSVHIVFENCGRCVRCGCAEDGRDIICGCAEDGRDIICVECADADVARVQLLLGTDWAEVGRALPSVESSLCGHSVHFLEPYNALAACRGETLRCVPCTYTGFFFGTARLCP
jgi:hypothetical protein